MTDSKPAILTFLPYGFVHVGLKTFSAWPKSSVTPAMAAMVDRLVHPAEAIVLKGNSYRLRSASTGVLAPSQTDDSGCSAFKPLTAR
jgi:hypothetical protein